MFRGCSKKWNACQSGHFILQNGQPETKFVLVIPSWYMELFLIKRLEQICTLGKACGLELYPNISKPLFLYLFVFWAISPSRRSLGSYGGGDHAISLRSHVPMERFFDGTDQESQKHKEEGDRSGKFKKTRKKDGGKKKKRFWRMRFHTHVFSISQEHPRANLPQENPLVWNNSPTT